MFLKDLYTQIMKEPATLTNYKDNCLVNHKLRYLYLDRILFLFSQTDGLWDIRD